MKQKLFKLSIISTILSLSLIFISCKHNSSNDSPAEPAQQTVSSEQNTSNQNTSNQNTTKALLEGILNFGGSYLGNEKSEKYQYQHNWMFFRNNQIQMTTVQTNTYTHATETVISFVEVTKVEPMDAVNGGYAVTVKFISQTLNGKNDPLKEGELDTTIFQFVVSSNKNNITVTHPSMTSEDQPLSLVYKN